MSLPTAKQFSSGELWERFHVWLLEQRSLAQEGEHHASDFATVRYFAGIVDAIDFFIDLPDKLLPHNELDPAPASETINITNITRRKVNQLY